MNRQQQLVIEYLQEEIRVLKEQHGKPPRFTDNGDALLSKARQSAEKVFCNSRASSHRTPFS